MDLAFKSDYLIEMAEKKEEKVDQSKRDLIKILVAGSALSGFAVGVPAGYLLKPEKVRTVEVPAKQPIVSPPGMGNYVALLAGLNDYLYDLNPICCHLQCYGYKELIIEKKNYWESELKKEVVGQIVVNGTILTYEGKINFIDWEEEYARNGIEKINKALEITPKIRKTLSGYMAEPWTMWWEDCDETNESRAFGTLFYFYKNLTAKAAQNRKFDEVYKLLKLQSDYTRALDSILLGLRDDGFGQLLEASKVFRQNLQRNPNVKNEDFVPGLTWFEAVGNHTIPRYCYILSHFIKPRGIVFENSFVPGDTENKYIPQVGVVVNTIADIISKIEPDESISEFIQNKQIEPKKEFLRLINEVPLEDISKAYSAMLWYKDSPYSFNAADRINTGILLGRITNYHVLAECIQPPLSRRHIVRQNGVQAIHEGIESLYYTPLLELIKSEYYQLGTGVKDLPEHARIFRDIIKEFGIEKDDRATAALERVRDVYASKKTDSISYNIYLNKLAKSMGIRTGDIFYDHNVKNSAYKTSSILLDPNGNPGAIADIDGVNTPEEFFGAWNAVGKYYDTLGLGIVGVRLIPELSRIYV